MASYCADRFGRRPCIFAGIPGVIVSTVIQVTAKHLPQLCTARWLVGIASMFATVPSSLIITELAYPSHRGKLTALYNTFYYFGAILASWACYGVNRYADAKAVLVKFHAGGDENSEVINIEISEIVEAIELEKHSKSTNWSELLKTPGSRQRTFITVSFGVFSQWCGNAVISYYFTLVLDTIGYKGAGTQTLINGLLQIFNFAAAIFAALMVDKLGRRILLLWSSAGMFISYIIWTVLSERFHATQGQAYGQSVLAFIFIFFFHYDLAFTPLVVSYSSEIFPYYLRSKGVALVQSVIYGALAVAQFCNSIAVGKLEWKYYILFCCINSVIVVVIFFFYPETKGYSLEEIAEIFDGPNTYPDIGEGDDKQKISHGEFSASKSLDSN
ncbi:unnamed protein product [Ambrosiozyma monospora]|uniref:Unnamed protein product n=1 Tax=Ambrosiozyma monospora TaxID=43982 RepID=A0ACB5T9F6_AMBMO|nr:unnamed protein product [Ambrosiozyma monospora]